MPVSTTETEALETAERTLRLGGLVGLPTETVYGLAANAADEAAVRRIFAAKGRPATHPLIVHLGDAAQLDAWASEVPEVARTLALAFWPGPLTLVVKRSRLALDVVTAGQDTVALRVPAHPLARALLQRLAPLGVAAPSANRHGSVSPTTAQHVRDDLGRDVDFVLDGGACSVGVESTIVDCSSGTPRLLRPGGLGREALERVLGQPVPLVESAEVRVSGTMESHYAPRAGLVLTTAEALADEVAQRQAWGATVAVLAPGTPALPPNTKHVRWGDDAESAARTLFAELRALDAQGIDVVVAVPPPEGGLGLAVRDRLRRAAAPRPKPPGAS